MFWLLLVTLSALAHWPYLMLLGASWRDRSSATSAAKPALPPLSIIVCFHNEEVVLQECLLTLLQQAEESDCEVLAINDRSADGSRAIVTQLQARHPRLRLLDITATPAGWAPKKWALWQGMQAASYPRLVMTDADCRPQPGWLAAMGAAFADGAELVLGYSPYRPQQPGLLHALQQLETWHTAVLYLGMARLGVPYMGVGRNWGIDRRAMPAGNPYGALKGQISGDDDLIVNHYGPSLRIKVITRPGSWVYSLPTSSWRKWWRQKTRHLSGSRGYSWGSQLLLGGYHLSLMGLYAGGMGGLLVGQGTCVALALFLIGTRGVGLGLLARRQLRFSAHSGILIGIDPALLLYNLLVVPASAFRKAVWK